MKLTAPTQEFDIHPAGIFPAVCVDVIDLGEHTVEYKGQRRVVTKVRLVFETAGEDGAREISRTFNASLHSKSSLAQFLSRWRGRPIVPGEEIDLSRVQGASCTLVLSHQPRMDGQGNYCCIDAVSRPSRQVKPSGKYDPVAARRRVQERKAAALADARGREPGSASDVGGEAEVIDAEAAF